MKNKTGFLKYEKHNISPFIEEMVLKTKDKTVAIGRKVIQVSDTDTGEIDTAFMYIKEKKDNEMFVKVFKAQIQAMFDLSKTSLKVLGYFMKATKINNDLIMFDTDECKKETGYSSFFPLRTGLIELLEKKIIARGKHSNLYYINPRFFFNGDRLVVVQDYWRKSIRNMKDPGQLDLLTGQTNKQMQKLNKKRLAEGKNEKV